MGNKNFNDVLSLNHWVTVPVSLLKEFDAIELLILGNIVTCNNAHKKYSYDALAKYTCTDVETVKAAVNHFNRTGLIKNFVADYDVMYDKVKRYTEEIGSSKPKNYKKAFSKYQGQNYQKPQEYRDEKMVQQPQVCQQEVKMVSQEPKSQMNYDETYADLQAKEKKQGKKLWDGIIERYKREDCLNFVLTNTEAMAGYIVAKTVDGFFDYNAAKSCYMLQKRQREDNVWEVFKQYGINPERKPDVYLPMISFEEAVREYRSTGKVKCFKVQEHIQG